jgi:predicted kinase
MSKPTVVNLRGTSGSGKTTIVRHILSHGHWETWSVQGKVLGYINEDLKWAVVGSYENTCGGCDGIKTQDETEDRIRFLLNYGYSVIFEGLLISTLTSRWENFAKSIDANMLFYYIDTPVEECIERVKLRRLQAGNTKPFNTENTVNRVKAIETTRQKLTAAGCYCLTGSQDMIMKNLYEWFGIGGYWNVSE